MEDQLVERIKIDLLNMGLGKQKLSWKDIESFLIPQASKLI